MYSGNLNNTRCDDPRKLMKQTSFKVKKKKTWGKQFQENNPLYQIEIHTSRISICSKSNYSYQFEL